MNFVEKEQLTGFRPPTAKERETAAKYLRKSFSGMMKANVFWNAFFCVFAAACLVNLLAVSDGKRLGANLLYFLFFIIFTAIVFWIRIQRKSTKQILEKVSRGEFQVMECRAYEVFFSAELMSKARVRIYNNHGQYCAFDFETDIGFARICENDKNTELLLLKCGRDFYELLVKQGIGGVL